MPRSLALKNPARMHCILRIMFILSASRMCFRQDRQDLQDPCVRRCDFSRRMVMALTATTEQHSG